MCNLPHKPTSYHPPDSSTKCLQELERSICLVRQRYPEAIHLLRGDFNLAGIDWKSLSHVPKKPKKEDCKLLLQISVNFHMDQLNHEPMRKKNILELLFSTCPELMTSCTTGLGISNHDHIVIAHANLRVKQNKTPRTIHLYKKTDWTAVNPS